MASTLICRLDKEPCCGTDCALSEERFEDGVRFYRCALAANAKKARVIAVAPSQIPVPLHQAIERGDDVLYG